MIITEKNVNESHFDEIVALVHNEDGLITLNKDEVKCILSGKEGTMYQADQETGVESGVFMKRFFSALKRKNVAHECTSMLISIAIPPEIPLMMEDVELVHDFIESVTNENVEIKWGIKNSEHGNQMSILTICTREK